MENIYRTFYTEILTISQKQAVINKIKSARNIKTQRPILLLNIDIKILSTAISNKLKAALLKLFSS